MGGRSSSSARSAKSKSSLSIRNNLMKAFDLGPSYRSYSMAEVLSKAPIGTEIYDGTTTLTDRNGQGWKSETTFFKKTSNYGWHIFGDQKNYSGLTENQVVKNFHPKDKNDIRVINN